MKTQNKTKCNKIKLMIRDGAYNYEITHFSALCLEGAVTTGSCGV